MAGRKGPKPGQRKIVVAKDVVKKSKKKLAKASRKVGRNVVDVEKSMAFKELSVSSHEVKYREEEVPLFYSLLKDGLAIKRLNGLMALTQALLKAPETIGGQFRSFYEAITPILLDDDTSIRRTAVEIAGKTIPEEFCAAADSSEFKNAYSSIRMLLWTQLRAALIHLDPMKRQDGLRYWFYQVQHCPPHIFGERIYMSRIFPCIYNFLRLGLKPGKVSQKKAIKGFRERGKRFTSLDDSLGPITSYFTPPILVIILSTFLHISDSSQAANETGMPYQLGLTEALDRCLKGPFEKNEGIQNVMTDCGCLPLVDFVAGLTRLGLTQLEDVQCRASALKNLSTVVLLSIVVMRWLVCMLMSHLNDINLNKSTVPAPIPSQGGARIFNEILFPSVVASAAKSQWQSSVDKKQPSKAASTTSPSDAASTADILSSPFAWFLGHGRGGSVLISIIKDILKVVAVLDNDKMKPELCRQLEIIILNVLLIRIDSSAKANSGFIILASQLRQQLTVLQELRRQFDTEDTTPPPIKDTCPTIPSPVSVTKRALSLAFGIKYTGKGEAAPTSEKFSQAEETQWLKLLEKCIACHHPDLEMTLFSLAAERKKRENHRYEIIH